MKYLKLFEEYNEIYYRGLHEGGKRNFQMQTWTKDKNVAEKYATVPIKGNYDRNKGIIQIAHLNFKNPLTLKQEGEMASQINVGYLAENYFTEKELRHLLKNITVRDYGISEDGEEKNGIQDTDKISDIEVVVFDLIDAHGFENLLKKHGYDAVIYLGWEGDGSLEYRTFDENIELLDAEEV
jgi:hypothetical protein